MGIREIITAVMAKANAAAGGGDALKAMAGLAAIQWGSATVREIAEEATERATEAGRHLAEMNDRIAEGEAGIVRLIAAGEFDAAVLERARALFQAEKDAGAGMDPDYYCGALDCGDVGHVHRPWCALCEKHVDEPHDCNPSRTAANGAPDGKPDVPPRMAGGYLPAYSAGARLANEVHGREPGSDVYDDQIKHASLCSGGPVHHPDCPYALAGPTTIPVSDGDDTAANEKHPAEIIADVVDRINRANEHIPVSDGDGRS